MTGDLSKTKPGKHFAGHLFPSSHFTSEFGLLRRAAGAKPANERQTQTYRGGLWMSRMEVDSLVRAVSLPLTVTFRRPFGQWTMRL